ncbi:hypothetical protein INT48_002957, partial [Thamnidium elegans]
CERHRVLRLRDGIANANNSDADYDTLKEYLLDKDINRTPDVIGQQSYRDALVFPLLKACLNIISNDKMLFIPGEVPLESMTCQLENLKKALAPNEKYYADGMEFFIKIILETQTKDKSTQIWYLNRLQENTHAIVRESKWAQQKKSIMQRTHRAVAAAESSQQVLSAIIKSSIIKLTESKHCKEFSNLGLDTFLTDSLLDT